MNTHKYILIFILLIIPIIAESQDYCSFIQRIQNYQDSVKLISSGDYDIIDTNTFDIQAYLSLFGAIEIEKGINIDVYYFDNFLDGNPFIYALKENKRLKTNNKSSLYRFLNDERNKGKNHIIPKATNIGFLQYLFFYEMGEQFALKWHAYDNEKYVVCSKEKLDKIVDELKEYNQEYDDSIPRVLPRYMVDLDELNELAKIDPTIEIESTNEYYTITWIEHRTHYGIDRCKYIIQRELPNTIELVNRERLLDITPGFLY